MNNLIRENLKTILELSDNACDTLSHMNGNYNLEEFGYRSGGVYHEDSKQISELREFNLINGPFNSEDYTEGCASFKLTTSGKDLAELLFWIENGEEKVELLQSGLEQAQDKSLFDLY